LRFIVGTNARGWAQVFINVADMDVVSLPEFFQGVELVVCQVCLPIMCSCSQLFLNLILKRRYPLFYLSTCPWRYPG
jgi:hypothetical protein